MPKRVLKGVVVNNKASKTVSVEVERRVQHAQYKKIIRKTKKYAAHDEENRCKIGDIVQIRESRPYSKTKRWEVIFEDKKAS